MTTTARITSTASRTGSARRPAAWSRSSPTRSTDPTVDSQIIELKNSGANVFYNVSISKFAAQAMRKAADLGWKPVQYMNNVAASVGTTMKPAGFDNVQGVLTAAWLKDPTDHQWDNEPDMKEWRAFMAKYIPDGNLADGSYVYAYGVAALMRKTLEKCGDVLTRENLMKQAASQHQLRPAGPLAGHHRHRPARPTSIRSRRCSCRASRARPGSCSAT